MRRFIRYLYEYEQGKPMRNVGFVKVEQGEDECMIHMHGKGLRLIKENSLKIYLFFVENGECICFCQGEADNINPSVNVQLHYTREDVGIPENFEKINGMILESDSGRKFAVLWEEMPVDLGRMREWSPKTGEEMLGMQEQREMPGERQEVMPEEMPRELPEEVPFIRSEGANWGNENIPGREPVMYDDSDMQREMPEEMSRESREEILSEQGRREMPRELPEEMPRENENRQFRENTEGDNLRIQPVMQRMGSAAPFWKVRKIQRTEISRLARCEWRLANNRFLMHGYYNYHHLVILENKNHMLLGIPGIYHEREASMAADFGFPEFVAADQLEVKLNPEEYNDRERFGYWCRPVRPSGHWN